MYSVWLPLVQAETTPPFSVQIREAKAAVQKNPRDAQALLQLGQALYREQDFASFFGLVQWVHLNTWGELASEMRDRWLATELMALARHCRWPEIRDLSRTEDSSAGHLSQRALAVIRLKDAYKKYESDPKPVRQPLLKRIEQSQSQWKAAPEDFRRLRNPLHLRAKVESQCSDS